MGRVLAYIRTVIRTTRQPLVTSPRVTSGILPRLVTEIWSSHQITSWVVFVSFPSFSHAQYKINQYVITVIYSVGLFDFLKVK